jgi:hypothetical protein
LIFAPSSRDSSNTADLTLQNEKQSAKRNGNTLPGTAVPGPPAQQIATRKNKKYRQREALTAWWDSAFSIPDFYCRALLTAVLLGAVFVY